MTTPVRIDATTHESFQRSFNEATEGMSADKCADVMAAIAGIWVYRGTKFPVTSPENDRAIEQAVHGMTISEILIEARREGFEPPAKNQLEMSQGDPKRWYEGEQPRFGDPKDYLPPNTVETMPCDYTKGDMHDIVIFASKGDLDDVGRWYTEQLPIHIYEKHDYDPGQLTLYSLHDRDSRSYSVILVDSETADATGNFGSYVGPQYLDRMMRHRPCIIGALYLSEDGWYDRNRST